MTPLVVAVVLFTAMEGLATLARGLAFTVAACVATFASAFLLAVALRFAGAVLGQTRARGVVALLVFVVAVGGSAYLLSSRFPVEDEPEESADGRETEDEPGDAGGPDESSTEGDQSEPTEH